MTLGDDGRDRHRHCTSEKNNWHEVGSARWVIMEEISATLGDDAHEVWRCWVTVEIGATGP